MRCRGCGACPTRTPSTAPQWCGTCAASADPGHPTVVSGSEAHRIDSYVRTAELLPDRDLSIIGYREALSRGARSGRGGCQHQDVLRGQDPGRGVPAVSSRVGRYSRAPLFLRAAGTTAVSTTLLMAMISAPITAVPKLSTRSP